MSDQPTAITRCPYCNNLAANGKPHCKDNKHCHWNWCSTCGRVYDRYTGTHFLEDPLRAGRNTK